jgi:hypothetical protein
MLSKTLDSIENQLRTGRSRPADQWTILPCRSSLSHRRRRDGPTVGAVARQTDNPSAGIPGSTLIPFNFGCVGMDPATVTG